ncbi:MULTISPECIES: DHH family phosphoesterase [Geobacter]|uniref:Phosphoesterase n=2 Tax=Geobacter TaxID=28231 RepID=A0A0C1TMM3_9BACT|nr:MULTISPECIES: DHH family phosphoesterase [Geobacter]ANA40247.1 phosphoesterase [Geobacter anodireducens]KIE42149.1 phosphoesterase [Geobacter soli]MBE2888659.1 DHH family phosphoesterase [Geobacter anodireducens]HMN01538.1 DHHA1 domain-containing protein [Geobacter anodireducens]
MEKEWSLAQTKSYTDEMLNWVRGKGRILIVVHDNPDPDCLASAIALRHLFVMKLNRDATIAFSGMIGRSENIAMAKQLQIPLTPLALIEYQDFSVTCMLDTQPGTGNNSLPPDRRVDILIDHHPRREAGLRCRWDDIREEYGVTATIVYEYLQAQSVPIGSNLATALFYAIKSETQDLGREAARPDRDAYLKLFPLANKKLLYEITYPKLHVEYYLTINRAIEHSRIYGNLLATNLREVSFPEIVAEMADFFLRLEGVDVVMAIGHFNRDVILSLRTSRHDVNAGALIKRLVEERGVAGGHGMMAGGKIEGLADSAAELEEIEQLLVRRFLDVFALGHVRPLPLSALRRTALPVLAAEIDNLHHIV